MTSDDLEESVRNFVAKHVGISPERLESETDVVDDLRIYGDDVWELVDDFAKAYKVSLDGFRWYHHTGPEGCNPLWLLSRPWWAKRIHVPIRLADMVESARRGVWSIEYPRGEAQPDDASERLI